MRLGSVNPLVVVPWLVLSAAIVSLPSAAIAADRVPLSVVTGNNAFAFDLYRQSVSPEEPNFVYSPFSISSAFGMLYAGARGSTAEEIARVMNWSVDAPSVHAALGTLSNGLNAQNGEQFEFAVANRLWGATGFPFKQPFLDTLESAYRAPLEPLDFQADAERARERINDWVKEQTRNKIPSLLPQGSVRPDTGLVLTNAVYMNAKWQSPFRKESTYTRAFHTSSEEVIGVSMMSQLTTLRYGEFDDFRMVEMPYRDSDVSMVVALPTEIDGLAALESSLTADVLQASIDAMNYTEVSLQLPKFRIETELELNGGLAALGMQETFGDANLSGITDDVGLALSKAIHKAVIEVDEAGTEAAAATALVLVTTTAYRPPVVYEPFHADHPFLYFLRDQQSGSVLFMGRLMEPDVADPNAIPDGIVNFPRDGILGPILNPDGVQVPEPSSLLLASLAVAAILICSQWPRVKTKP